MGTGFPSIGSKLGMWHDLTTGAQSWPSCSYSPCVPGSVKTEIGAISDLLSLVEVTRLEIPLGFPPSVQPDCALLGYYSGVWS